MESIDAMFQRKRSARCVDLNKQYAGGTRTDLDDPYLYWVTFVKLDGVLAV